MTDPTGREIRDAVARLSREEGGRVLALLARRFQNLDLADDAVQDALVTALSAWTRGIPDNPAAWLYTVARNGAIDSLRRAEAARRRLRESAPELTARWDEEPDPIMDDSTLGDERLRLLLLCCHPALNRDTQVALTLRLAGGLTTTEIAAAFLLPEATLAQRIVRAKRKIRQARIPLSIPADLSQRIDALLGVIYLIFNEGYLSRGSNHTVRHGLVDEAVRLTTQTHAELPENPEVAGLLALELFHRARRATRTDQVGELVLLEDQDRSRWDADGIEQGNRMLAAALAAMQPGPYQLQAVIAGHHANARTAADTDWPAIVSLYSQLVAMTGSPVVELNRAIAIAMADGAGAGLAALDRITGLESYHLFHATRGELLVRAGRASAAEFGRALELAANEAERRHLERRIRTVTEP